MLKKIFVIVGLLFIAAPMVFADITQKDIDKAIDKGKLKHPYLYFSEEDKPGIFERIKNEQEYGDIMNRLLAEANRLMYTPVPSHLPVQTKTPRYSGDELEQELGVVVEAAFSLAFVYQMTGEEKYARKAFEFADLVCDQPTWVPGAHLFPTIYDRVWPWGAKDDQVVFSYGQHTDHTVFRMAAVYDWLYNSLDKRQRDRIRGALLEKALLTVRGNYEYHWWARAYRCNWCAVCNSSLGVAAIALLTEDPQLTDIIAESYNRIGKTLDQISDGGWQEGLGYLAYTVWTSLDFAGVLKRVSDGKVNLYKHPRFDDAVKTFIYCQIPPDRSLHFGDSGSGKIGTYNMFNQLMLETGNRYAAWLRKHFFNDRPDRLFDLLKPGSTLEPALPKTPSIHFPAVDWVIMRSDFTDPEKVVIAAKAGKNDDPHHGHLDCGHFILYWKGKEFIRDHGSAGYDKVYFDKERWDYPLASSIGHNVVLVNGEKQLACKLKNQPWNEDIGGKVIEFRPGDDRDYTLMDPSNAYPKKELKSWRRHIVLDKPVITVVLDEVKSAKGAEIEVRFHSAVPYDIGNGYVLLNGDNGLMALIPVVAGHFTVSPGKHAVMMAQVNANLRRVPYFGTVVKAERDKTIIGTIILPVDDEREAGAISSSVKRTVDISGNLDLSFVKDGETYSYKYNSGKDGLVLE